ncbi:hypothetical protein HanIR_Chr14g0718601 [Helianthus annuus]|nr:hypothetical protein HanIR_Chr14g0718601 [Helianthus annuus]
MGAPHGDELGWINPLSSNSCSCFLSSCISVGASLYGDLAIGDVPGTRSMRNSTCLSDGSPGSSSGNTSGYSRTTGTSSTFCFSVVFMTYARKATYPFLRHLCAFAIVMRFFVL